MLFARTRGKREKEKEREKKRERERERERKREREREKLYTMKQSGKRSNEYVCVILMLIQLYD